MHCSCFTYRHLSGTLWITRYVMTRKQLSRMDNRDGPLSRDRTTSHFAFITVIYAVTLMSLFNCGYLYLRRVTSITHWVLNIIIFISCKSLVREDAYFLFWGYQCIVTCTSCAVFEFRSQYATNLENSFEDFFIGLYVYTYIWSACIVARPNGCHWYWGEFRLLVRLYFWRYIDCWGYI